MLQPRLPPFLLGRSWVLQQDNTLHDMLQGNSVEQKNRTLGLVQL